MFLNVGAVIFDHHVEYPTAYSVTVCALLSIVALLRHQSGMDRLGCSSDHVSGYSGYTVLVIRVENV